MRVGIGARSGDVHGQACLFRLGTDYMLTRHWGLGMTYRDSRVDVDVTRAGLNGTIDWNANSVMACAGLKF